ncbi:prolipoprotein diacylglyceryl transferase [Flavobacterium sp.]|uniref:prolipoprotein diacylglyceryl transferase n=1 Tax=Flavobacterium sp. TaxID=239 RepID=UPI002630D12B|nr:prolipoprotein diacylglyceryl transferase [Flavobacterium sp.]
MIWNPSEGIDLGPLTIRFYSLMFVVAFGLGWYIMKRIFIKENLSLEKLDTLFVWTVLATLLGARLGHVFFYDWEYFKNNPMEILLPFKFQPEFHFTGFQGLASHGAAVAIIIAMYFYSKNVAKKPILWVLDRVVIPVSCGAIFVRLGNFFNSEIVGNITSSEFGVRFIRDKFSSNDVMNITGIKNTNEAYSALVNNPKYISFLNQVPLKHPAQLYEAFFYIFVFAILMFLYWKTNFKEKHGLIFGVFLVLLWTVRFFVENVKESQGGIEKSLGLFSTGQWLSIPFILLGVVFIFLAEKPLPKDLFKDNDVNPDKLF